LQGALRTESNNREALLTLIRDQTALGQLDLATARAAMEAFPRDTELNYAIGLACLDRVREIASSATELGPDSPPSLWLRLRRAESAGDSRIEDKLRLRLAGMTEPESVVEYDSVSSVLRKGFEAVLANAPDSNAAHSIRGYLFESTGKLDAALAEYREAGDHFAAGRLLAQNVRLSEAESEFKAAVSGDPENDRAKADLGRLYVQKNEPGKATGVLEDLVKKYPKDPYAWADLGKAQGVLGNYGAAIQCLKTALSLNPDLNQLHYQLALLYRKQGREDLTSSELAVFQGNRRKNP
jgi:tetratricopeptide (TPR) repeat protein